MKTFTFWNTLRVLHLTFNKNLIFSMVIQNFYLISSALDLGCCALGNVLDDKLDEILDLDPLEETTIGILVIGNEK